MKKKLLIIGAGTHGKVVEEVALSMKDINDNNIYEKVDFLDDFAEGAVGKISSLNTLGSNYDAVFVAIGDNKKRSELCMLAESLGYELPILVHPSAYVSESVIVEKGVIIEPRVSINSNTVIKKGTIVSIGAIIDHNVVLDEFCHVNTGAICCAGSTVDQYIKTAAGGIVEGF